MYIDGKRVRIRAIEEADLDFLYDMVNSRELDGVENGYNFPISKSGQKEWYEKQQNSDRNGKFIIEFEGKAVGHTSIINIDWKNRSAHTGIKILSDEYKGIGIGQDAVMAIMRYCFDELQLNRLEGFMLEQNLPSIKLYVNKCGWQIEGNKREYVYKNGKYHNLVIVGILEKEYRNLIQCNNYWDNMEKRQ